MTHKMDMNGKAFSVKVKAKKDKIRAKLHNCELLGFKLFPCGISKISYFHSVSITKHHVNDKCIEGKTHVCTIIIS